MKGWVHHRRERLLREAAERERLEEQEREARAQRVAWRKRLALQHTVSVTRKPNGRVFLDMYFSLANGPNVIDGPPLVIGSMDDARVLGEAVLEGLRKSYSRILPARNLRTDPGNIVHPELRKAKTWSEYMRHATLVSVSAEFDDLIEEVEITPERNKGRGSSVPISDERITITYESPEQLGRAVQAAMGKATTD